MPSGGQPPGIISRKFGESDAWVWKGCGQTDLIFQNRLSSAIPKSFTRDNKSKIWRESRLGMEGMRTDRQICIYQNRLSSALPKWRVLFLWDNKSKIWRESRLGMEWMRTDRSAFTKIETHFCHTKIGSPLSLGLISRKYGESHAWV